MATGAARIAPGPALSEQLRPVAPGPEAVVRGAALLAERRALGLDIRDAARAAFVPARDLLRIEQGLAAFGTAEAYQHVAERLRSAAAWRARRASGT